MISLKVFWILKISSDFYEIISFPKLNELSCYYPLKNFDYLQILSKHFHKINDLIHILKKRIIKVIN